MGTSSPQPSDNPWGQKWLRPRAQPPKLFGSAVGLVIGGEDLSRDATAIADLMTVVARPLTNCAQVTPALPTSGCLARVLAAARAARMTHPRRQVVTQLLGMSCGQVNLV